MEKANKENNELKNIPEDLPELRNVDFATKNIGSVQIDDINKPNEDYFEEDSLSDYKVSMTELADLFSVPKVKRAST